MLLYVNAVYAEHAIVVHLSLHQQHSYVAVLLHQAM